MEVSAEHGDDIRSFDDAAERIPVVQTRLHHPWRGRYMDGWMVQRQDGSLGRRVLEQLRQRLELGIADAPVREPGDETVQGDDAEPADLAYRGAFVATPVEKLASVRSIRAEVAGPKSVDEPGAA